MLEIAAELEGGTIEAVLGESEGAIGLEGVSGKLKLLIWQGVEVGARSLGGRVGGAVGACGFSAISPDPLWRDRLDDFLGEREGFTTLSMRDKESEAGLTSKA
jgi:hypothetical protein